MDKYEGYIRSAKAVFPLFIGLIYVIYTVVTSVKKQQKGKNTETGDFKAKESTYKKDRESVLMPDDSRMKDKSYRGQSEVFVNGKPLAKSKTNNPMIKKG